MEGGDSVLDSVFENESFEDLEDVEMLDVEDGELVEQNPSSEQAKSTAAEDVSAVNVEDQKHKRGKRKNKKKNKRKRGTSGPNGPDINRFVVDICRRLKERKSYLVWTAVGCLGISALSDLVKEVDAIMACGGQKTADGRRYRTGGGILWSILKVRDPNAYREIMKKGKDFEKQFKPHALKQGTPLKREDSFQGINFASSEQTTFEASNGSELASHVPNQSELINGEQKRASVHDRVRMPVAYDDLLEGENLKDA